MKSIFKKRQLGFLNQTSKYLRYVFNDHFVLVLIFLLGFLMVQYSQLLRHFPSNPVPIILVVGAVILFLLFWGNSATYLEQADQQFLLVKEQEVISLIQQAKRRAMVFWISLQTLFLLILVPLFLRLSLSPLQIALLLLSLAFLKALILEKKSQVYLHHGQLDWTKALKQEHRRQQTILKFFSLFTNVKGLTSSVKRRSYLDIITTVLPKKHSSTWTNLYLRAFLRSGDYLGLFVRLGLLSLLSLLFIANPFVSAAFVVLFNYLLLFQLLALYKHYDYQYLTALFPIDKEKKRENLSQFLRGILYLLTLLELCLSLSWSKAVFLLVAMLFLNEIYLRYKLKRIID